MKRLNERDLTRSFLNTLNENMHIQHCETHDTVSELEHDHHEHGESHAPLQHGEDGIINKEELYNHFDLDNDGIVTTDEYADHIEYHAAHPESLEKYRSLRNDSCRTVPCSTSYDSCGSYCISDPESMKSMLEPILSATGATCHTSAVQSMLDVLKSLKECGVI